MLANTKQSAASLRPALVRSITSNVGLNNMSENGFILLMLALGLVAGNFAYQAFFLAKGMPALWSVAVERSFFQCFALLLAAWAIK